MLLICLILAIVGLALVLLSVFGIAPQGLHAGIALIVIGVILYVVLLLVAHSAAYGP